MIEKFTEGHDLRYSIRHPFFKTAAGYKILCVIFMAMLLSGCAPTLYSVDMKYVPTKYFPREDQVKKPIGVTVAAFQDMRKTNDNMIIGHVTEINGQQVPVLPKFVTPSKAVTQPIKEFLSHAGYLVAPKSPDWDLQESSMNKEWGPILVGGSIDELDVVCLNSPTTAKYKAKVQLTIYLADVPRGKIFHTITMNSNTSLDHVIFSEKKLEEQLNIALSDGIEKLFEDGEIKKIIDEEIKQTP